MTAQPLPKTSELIDEINSYFAKHRKPTDWQVKLLKKKADTLRGKIPENHYYDMLGMISGLENDIAALTKYYQIALNQTSTAFQTQDNYLIALHNKGLYSKALAHGKTVLANFPEHSEKVLSSLVRYTFMACRMNEAFGFLTRLKIPDQHEYYQNIKESIAIFETARLNDDEAERLQSLAYSVIQKNNLYFSAARTIITRGCIHYQIYVDRSIEEMFGINWQLADVLVENTENTHSDAIMFEYESVDVFEESQAS